MSSAGLQPQPAELDFESDVTIATRLGLSNSIVGTVSPDFWVPPLSLALVNQIGLNCKEYWCFTMAQLLPSCCLSLIIKLLDCHYRNAQRCSTTQSFGIKIHGRIGLKLKPSVGGPRYMEKLAASATATAATVPSGFLLCPETSLHHCMRASILSH